MSSRRARVIALWSLTLVLAIGVVAHARYITDLTAFLPAKPTPTQKLLVDQLRDGPASRLILIALEHADSATRARLATELAGRLRLDREFASVDDGEPRNAERDQEFLFGHRYLLSPAVTPAHFSIAGLRAALRDTIESLASSSGLLLKGLVPHDPTGEMLRVIDQLTHTQGPQTRDGVWASADGSRTLLVAQTAAAGSDTDAQEHAVAAITQAFAASTADADTTGGRDSAVRLRMSGPGVFAVAARAKIKRAATRLSVISGILVVGVLLAVYRSVPALVLGLLPVVSGALVGIAAVALGFGAVHGITLGFGITLIGESVDYSIYFFIQSLRSDAASGTWQQRLWPTIRLGMLTSVCGFASLLPSGFPGLAQLGLYSISGLLAAAAVTRFVLPELLPHGFAIRDVTPLGLRLALLRDAVRRRAGRGIALTAWVLAVAALVILYRHHATVWNRELSSLSPVAPDELRYDATLRADLGSADVLDLVIVSGPTQEAVLQEAERAATTLSSLIDSHVIGDFDSPANYLPSLATQTARRAALPDPTELRSDLRHAAEGLDLQLDQLAPFIDDVAAARGGALLTADSLAGTSLATGFDSLILHRDDHWSALLPLHAPAAKAGPPAIDVVRVSDALTAAGLLETRVLDLSTETNLLYATYLQEAMRLSLAGLVLIVLLLWLALRSVRRLCRVLAPLFLAVVAVAATLVLTGHQLTLLHLVGMLLIVAVGSNYALFFDKEGNASSAGALPLTLASLCIANLSTVIGFGLLSFSRVPVLEALGFTVAPGAFLALLFSALLTSPARDAEDWPCAAF